MCKIDKNNQTLLELRSQSVNEQSKLQDTGGEDDANESDVTAVTEKTLDNDDETTLRGKDLFFYLLWSKGCCQHYKKSESLRRNTCEVVFIFTFYSTLALAFLYCF